jgi:uncharacterized membrane protein
LLRFDVSANKEIRMNKDSKMGAGPLLAAAGIGALAMYLLDPQQGRRRVALARDRMARLAHSTGDFADAGVRDLAGRSKGVAAELGSMFRRPPADDVVLVERVRTTIGRCVSHPHAIQVSASAGRVTLAGPILQSEQRRLVRGVRAVPGVRAVDNRLDVHASAGNLPALQGGIGRHGPRADAMLGSYGLGRRSLAGTVLGALGIGLSARAAANQDLGRLVGIAGGRHAIDVQKTIHIAAPRERVFALWSNPENFPHFMCRVQEVCALDDTRSHWVVKGPAGTHVEWDSVVTERIEPELIAWRSEPGSSVQHAGSVRFDADPQGTRVSVRLSYNPPAGALGHGVASLLGFDPKHDLDADLMRMKSFIETGTPPHDAAQRSQAARPETAWH